jgi:hypothetical protein
MKEPLHDTEATLVVSGEETTLVAPRFDDEEALVARPVVPLEGDAHVPTHEPPAPVYRSPYAPRRAGMLGLALVSVLVGGVLGGAGLYLYQRQSQDSTASPAATTTQPETAADAAQAPHAPAAEVQPAPTAAPTAQQSDVQTNDAPGAKESAPPAPDKEEPAAAPTREPENVPAAERRTPHAEDGEDGTPKRGKKGKRDQETERRTTPPTDGNVARDEEREARRVDSIFYRPRRANRRARRDGDVDRLRRIFEGTPE